MNEEFLLENQSDRDYILEFQDNGEKYFAFIFSGEKRVFKCLKGESNLKLSSNDYKLKDFSFNAKFPGIFLIEKTNIDEIDRLTDNKTGISLNLKIYSEINIIKKNKSNLNKNNEIRKIIKFPDQYKNFNLTQESKNLLLIKFSLS